MAELERVLEKMAELERRVGVTRGRRFTVVVRFKDGFVDFIEDGKLAVDLGTAWAIVTEDWCVFYGPTLADAYAAYARDVARLYLEAGKRRYRWWLEGRVTLDAVVAELEEAERWIERAKEAEAGEAVFELSPIED